MKKRVTKKEAAKISKKALKPIDKLTPAEKKKLNKRIGYAAKMKKDGKKGMRQVNLGLKKKK